MTLKVKILQSLRRLFIILIFNICRRGLMPNSIKKSWTVSNVICASGIWMATNDVCHNSHTRAQLNVVLLDKLMGWWRTYNKHISNGVSFSEWTHPPKQSPPGPIFYNISIRVNEISVIETKFCKFKKDSLLFSNRSS